MYNVCIGWNEGKTWKGTPEIAGKYITLDTQVLNQICSLSFKLHTHMFCLFTYDVCTGGNEGKFWERTSGIEGRQTYVNTAFCHYVCIFELNLL